MTLWDLMTALCAAMPVAGALATVRGAQKGWLGYGIAIIVGVLIGVLCAWAMRATGTRLAGRSGAGPDKRRLHFRLLYVGAAAWIILALFIGSWLAGAVIHRI
ncbi:MAG TPA: hypothetical protein VFA89_07835 [Terriglobales bacterium]|nr:hypothetical protein [Terriglobales bacterium]